MPSQPLRPQYGRHLPFLGLILFLLAIGEYVRWNMDRFYVVLFFSRLFFQLALGVTMIAVVRNVIGIRTLGTFAPAIIALAFLQTGPFIGLLLLLNIVAVVVLARQVLAEERIQQAHRVAILVILVVLAIALLELLAEAYRFPEIGLTFLFPVLITAWFAERFVERVDRLGWTRPSVAFLGTVLMILLAWFVMSQEWLVVLVIQNPESWALLVVLNYVLGTRIQYRLIERIRFRPVREAVPPNAPPGYLSINIRNRDFISRYNPSSVFPHVTKRRLKERLVPAGVPMPRTLLVVRGREDMGTLEQFLRNASSFAMKPVAALGGEGILIVRGRTGEAFDTNLGPMRVPDVLAHARRILDAEFGAGPVQALIEEFVEQHPALRRVAPSGLADVRVLSFLGYPVMAMIRFPTAESKGRSNLHSGGIGCGVDLRMGRITNAIWYGKPITRHPDTGAPLVGLEIPSWPEILDVACHAQDLSGLGYAGVDVVLDAVRGPLVLEVNKRPGLEIQNANRHGLVPRLRFIESLGARGEVADRIAAALRLEAAGWKGVSG